MNEIDKARSCEDCISREEAVKKLKALSWTNYDLNDAAEVLKRLPSVQPKIEVSEDCISRTRLLARIDEERKYLLDIKMDGAEHIIVHHARRIIEDMPSVNPEGENFTDEEKRIFLASVAREMRVCEVIDSEKTKVKLVPILERVKDKVLRSSLWKEVEE